MTKPTTLRLSEKEKEEALKKAEAYGLPNLSSVIRFALKKLRYPNHT